MSTTRQPEMENTLATTKLCTLCKTNPALGVGAGKMKSTCAGCIASLMAEGTCPGCRGVECYTPEHLAECTGKLPKFEPVSRKKPKQEKSLAQTEADDVAAERARARRQKERAKAMEEQKAAGLVPDDADRCPTCSCPLDGRRCANDDCADVGKTFRRPKGWTGTKQTVTS